MDWFYSSLAVAAGLLLRFGIPLFVTVLIVWWLRRMDERWKSQLDHDQAALALHSQAKNTGCWKINQCSPEKRAACLAFAHPDQPCWQVFRKKDGRLQESCLACRIFQTAPIPA